MWSLILVWKSINKSCPPFWVRRHFILTEVKSAEHPNYSAEYERK
jgi:hypothetical protein